ncbi:MAG TPA: hypothetical protein VHP63_07780 [candidate division Zixibacteria bacterium]|nr:hypothetical protein [candidate division Zixibacteria bacterium]
MIAISKKTKLVSMLTLLGIVASVGLVSYTEICNLQAVTLNGEKIEKWDKKLPLVQNESILQQPFAEFVQTSLADDETLKLDYRYSWPHTLLVRVNSISPDGLILDKNSAALFGLDKNGRIIPLKSEVVDWERPVFTGVNASKMYQGPADLRVRKVLSALGKIRSERVNFYRLIEQIDFNSKDYVEVSLAGHEHLVRLRAEVFYEDINRYLDFVARFRPALEGIKVIDLRQDGQIITKGKKA